MIVADLRLRVMLLTHLVAHLAEDTECGELGPHRNGGVSELARLTFEELVQLARTGLPRVEVHLDSSGIEHGLRTMHDIRIRAHGESFVFRASCTPSRAASNACRELLVR